MADHSKKRKQTSDTGPTAKRPRSHKRPQHHIAATPTKSIYPNGEINVKNFIASHTTEIKALEHGIRAAKKGLARRAFQDVPRGLRRRTASHNPQRVPKRLRARARQEAKEDNTPIARGKSGSGAGKGKGKYLRQKGAEKSRQVWADRAKRRKERKYVDVDMVEESEKDTTTQTTTKTKIQPNAKRKFPALSTPATPPSRFRRRQQHKTWLPTHIWHTKRARMTDPKQPLWRFSIPLAPVVKAYRLTHRAAAQQGGVAWDMSYMSTMSLEGVEASIVGLLKGLYFAIDSPEDPWQDRGRAKKWRSGTRSWEGWICEREAKPPKKIAQITVIWCVSHADDMKRKAFIRTHPAAFLQLWNEVIRISKVQCPAVAVQDLRFEVGSIEIMGPAAAETLCSILSPIQSVNNSLRTPSKLWPTLAPVTDARSLPPGALLAFGISDPRLRDPPTTSEVSQDQQSLTSLTETLALWPVDSTQTASTIFDTDPRLAASRLMPSQKSVNRRKSACTLGEHPAVRPTDPLIPILIYVSRESNSWTVLLPWKWVMPVWRGIMRYPLSTGGNPRFGGLQERRQINFERSVPFSPYDHPGTDAGWAWELREREARKHEWTKRPKGKRIEWSAINLGNGRKGEIGDPWACQWERLLPSLSDEVPAEPTEPKESEGSKSPFRQLTSTKAADILEGRSSASGPPQTPELFTVKVTMIQRGTPTDCARIYRLPTNNPELRTEWLSQIPRPGFKQTHKKQPRGNSGYRSEHTLRKNFTRILLEPQKLDDGPPKAGEGDYPMVPEERDLIGFVTAGNYNLAEGVPTAVANFALHRVCGDGIGGESRKQCIAKEDRICIVRQAGSTIGRVARWEFV